MTAFLPEFLPDELLYIMIARWRDRMCPRDQKTVLVELFGPGSLPSFGSRPSIR